MNVSKQWKTQSYNFIVAPLAWNGTTELHRGPRRISEDFLLFQCGSNMKTQPYNFNGGSWKTTFSQFNRVFRLQWVSKSKDTQYYVYFDNFTAAKREAEYDFVLVYERPSVERTQCAKRLKKTHQQHKDAQCWLSIQWKTHINSNAAKSNAACKKANSKPVKSSAEYTAKL